MQKQNPVIKNYILSSEKYVLEEKTLTPKKTSGCSLIENGKWKVENCLKNI